MIKVSGLPLISSFETVGGLGKLPGRLILLRKNALEYVSAWQSREPTGGFADEGWHNGVYAGYRQAVDDHVDRVKRSACDNPSQAAFVDLYGHYLCPSCWHEVEVSRCCLVFPDTECRDCHAVADGSGAWRQSTTVEDMNRSVR